MAGYTILSYKPHGMNSKEDIMIYKATNIIAEALDEMEIIYTVHDLSESSAVKVSWNGEVAKDQTVYFISRDDDNDVHVENMALAHVPESKQAKVLDCLNGLNRRFRYAKFTLDNDSDIRMEYDIPLRAQEVGPIAVEVFLRFMSITDEAYPEIMKAIWG